jgi:hypothetical protein
MPGMPVLNKDDKSMQGMWLFHEAQNQVENSQLPNWEMVI